MYGNYIEYLQLTISADTDFSSEGQSLLLPARQDSAIVTAADASIASLDQTDIPQQAIDLRANIRCVNPSVQFHSGLIKIVGRY